MSARPTTSPAWRARYSSSAYSRLVSATSRPRAQTRCAGDVDRQVTDFDALGRERPPIAPGQRAHARQQLAEIERLGEVIVGAGVEPLRPAPRPHRAPSASAPGTSEPAARSSRQTVEAVLAGQHDVEHRPRRSRSAGTAAPRRAVVGDVHRVPGFAQPLAMNRARARLVLDQQDPHARATS